MDSHPRTGKRCKKSYRYNKSTKMCHSTLASPALSPGGTSHVRTGKRCKSKFRYNKSKKLCVSKLNSPSPVSDASYKRVGRRCKKSYKYHKPSGLCVKSSLPQVNRESPLPYDRQDELVDEFVTPVNSVVKEDVFYSPESPVTPKPNKRDRLNMLKNMGIEL